MNRYPQLVQNKQDLSSQYSYFPNKAANSKLILETSSSRDFQMS